MSYPEGTIFIELAGVYDGWSVAQLPDGTLKNRWEFGSKRWKETQEFIDNFGVKKSSTTR